jgi:hypothetical protein
MTVTVPFEAQSLEKSLVWERIVNLQADLQKHNQGRVLTQKVAIAGIVKNMTTSLPLADTEVTVVGTEKTAIANREGLFFFDNLPLGNYILRFNCPGYVPQHSNFLVDSQNYSFKEIFLTPV